MLDTSVLIAIRQGEPERERFHDILLKGEPVASIVTLTETTMVWQARFGAADLAKLDAMLALYGIASESVSASDQPHLRHAVTTFARGRRAEPAALNFGDLFAYALARRLALPLLCKGDDFVRTDIQLVPF
ncbi:MAG TPA: type II toxin-antitoxin system VapC family toxin [Geminicoccaceae bacterium]|nr:type II toxin-antitoxin system VapC family toxin [Geminicoccus sp.]HMU53180.1 type II toxin-antitoxin system VapC family toxin [Geminicoccaceae bacterium]